MSVTSSAYINRTRLATQWNVQQRRKEVRAYKEEHYFCPHHYGGEGEVGAGRKRGEGKAGWEGAREVRGNRERGREGVREGGKKGSEGRREGGIGKKGRRWKGEERR